MKTLVIIDMQNDFITGPLGTPEAQEVEKRIVKWLRTTAYDTIIFTRDTHTEDYLATPEGERLPIPHCIYGTEGWLISRPIMDELYEQEKFYALVNKTTFGYPNWEEFPLCGKADDEIDIVGVCTDICVVSNALILKAEFPSADIKVIAALCAGTTPENHDKALDIMQACQIDII